MSENPEIRQGEDELVEIEAELSEMLETKFPPRNNILERYFEDERRFGLLKSKIEEGNSKAFKIASEYLQYNANVKSSDLITEALIVLADNLGERSNSFGGLCANIQNEPFIGDYDRDARIKNCATLFDRMANNLGEDPEYFARLVATISTGALGEVLSQDFSPASEFRAKIRPLVSDVVMGKADHEDELYCSVIKSLILDYNRVEDIPEASREIIGKKISGYGLDPDTVFSAWQKASDWEVIQDVYIWNLTVMDELEEKEPGSLKALHQRFNLINFGRYSPVALERQYREMDNSELPYGLLVVSRSDYNAGFYGLYDHIEDLSDQLEDNGYHLRICETGEKAGVYKNISKCNRLYGQQGDNLIEFLILAGHGTPEQVQFGDKKYRCMIMRYDFIPGELGEENEPRREEIVSKTKSYLADEPQIVLLSCSTGKGDENIAASIAKEYSAEVIAPDDSCRLKNLEVEFIDGKPKLEVEYDYDIEE